MSGGKVEITERIGYFLDTGNISDLMSSNKSKCQIGIITEDSKIEENFGSEFKKGCGKNRRAGNSDK